MRGARCDRSGRKSGEGSAAPGPKSPRWSAERRASLAEGRKAPHKRLACRVKARRPGASHERPYVSRCSAHPSFRVSEAKSKTRAQKRAAGTKRCCLKLRLSVGHSGRGAIAARAGPRPGMTRKNAPREREGLFAMVKLFEMVSWPENAILVLILRSAHVQQVPQARTCVARVSKDEDGDGVGALMLRDASQRSEAAEAAVLALRCNAPLHEGGRRPGRWLPRLRSNRAPCLRVLLRCHRIITRRSHAARLHLGRTFGFDCRNRREAL